jgi:uncharacterized LabA/DUF88 family protein
MGTMKMENDRRLWLIDAGYLFNGQRSVNDKYYFDYLKLRAKIEERGDLVQAYYLNSTPNPPADEMNQFHAWLRSAPPRGPKFQVKLYGLKKARFECKDCKKTLYKNVQKGVDIAIATLALTLLDRYDTLVLSTGDGDFEDAIEYIRNVKNKRVELWVFKKGVSTVLQSIADEVVWIDDFAAEVASKDAVVDDTLLSAEDETGDVV